MNSLIVDASVVAKRLVLEPDTDKAKVLFTDWGRGELEILAPAILPAEIANMLWKRARRALLPTAIAEELFREFNALYISLGRSLRDAGMFPSFAPTGEIESDQPATTLA